MPDSDGDGSFSLYRYRFGTSEFDESSFELLVSGQVVPLQRKPLEVLAGCCAMPARSSPVRSSRDRSGTVVRPSSMSSTMR